MKDRPIVIIDDDQRVREGATTVLMVAGFEVVAAPDRLKGIETARVTQPAVILLDMMMPGMDGIDTCQRLKKDRVLGDIPIIAITTSPDLKYTERAFYVGAEFFLPKPFGAESLVHMVRLAVDVSQRDGPNPLRAHPRFPAELPVRCLVGSDSETTRELMGQTENVSLGGLLLLLPESIDPETVLRRRLHPADEPITSDGTVVWNYVKPLGERKVPHGIRLLRFLDEADLVRYRRFLNRVAEGQAS